MPESSTYVRSAIRGSLRAYEHRRLDMFDSLLAEDFIFRFGSYDRQQPYCPDSLTRLHEHIVHLQLFDPFLTKQLYLALGFGSFEIDPTRSTATDTVWLARTYSGEIYSYGSTLADPDRMVECVPRYMSERFWFRASDWSDPDSGERLWQIIEWEDGPFYGSRQSLTVGFLPQDSGTWGGLKLHYLLDTVIPRTGE